MYTYKGKVGLTEVLEKKYPWKKWCDYFFAFVKNRDIIKTPTINGEFVGKVLKKYLIEEECYKEINHYNSVKAIETIFYLNIREFPDYKNSEGTVEFIPNNSNPFLIKYSPKSIYTRKRNLILHEIGHIFCEICWEFMEKIDMKNDIPVSNNERETWCWEFATYFSAPFEVRRKWESEMINQLRDEKLLTYLKENKLNFSFLDLIKIGSKFGLSIGNTIHCLNKLPLLNEMRFGIAVFSMAKSRKKQENYALRIYQIATPTWGYIICNQRVFKQGFKLALNAYKELKPGNSIVVDDIIYPKYRLNEDDRGFTGENEIELKTNIEYTGLKKGEKKLIISIWNWPNYNEYKSIE